MEGPNEVDLPNTEAETDTTHVNASDTALIEDDVDTQASQRASSTNSLVTVRLSGLESSQDINPSHEIDTQEDKEDPDTSHTYEQLPIVESHISSDELDAGHTNLQNELAHLPRLHRASTISMPGIQEEAQSETASVTVRSRSNSTGTFSSTESTNLDWEELEKNESQAPRDEGSDESTTFLLARLEQENNALATDPKSGLSKTPRSRAKSRPPSIQHLKNLVNAPPRSSIRYSLTIQTPQMSELDFWAALVRDYSSTAQRLPTLTSSKIRAGIPPPLRGVVWLSIAGACNSNLEEEYERLVTETSPYENLIGKDIGRSFPNVEMFRDPSGEGQLMLGKVLKAFSLHDEKIGYCQGLGFVVGPLLMHMGDREAFCVLVRLMEQYDLRSCFLPDLSGLHLRIYQFQQLLSRHLPRVTAHLDGLQVEPLYVSQWFLSFFGVTCPLPMLLRIYDVILTEGASETLMRVALSLMRRNQERIMKCTEFEDVMSLLLSRSLWDTYGCNAEDLVNDFVGLTGLVTRASLESLEVSFKETQNAGSETKGSSFQSVQTTASRFLGRFWAGSTAGSKVTSPTNLSASEQNRPSSILKRTTSKQSMASTLNSIESIDSQLSAASTEATDVSRSPSADCTPKKASHQTNSVISSAGVSIKDRDLHGQIEDLLTALSDMQREQAVMVAELQREREAREEDEAAVRQFLRETQCNPDSASILSDFEDERADEDPVLVLDMQFRQLSEHFSRANLKRSSTIQSKVQLREDVRLWKNQYEAETTRHAEAVARLNEQDYEKIKLQEQLQEARNQTERGLQEQQRLQQTIQDMQCFTSSRSSSSSLSESEPLSAVSTVSDLPPRTHSASKSITLIEPQPSPQSFAKRTSSLNMQSVLATTHDKPVADEAILLELVNAKTSEAVARQELEEVKGKLDSLRKMLDGGTSPGGASSGHRPSPSEPMMSKVVKIPSPPVNNRVSEQEKLKVTPPPAEKPASTGGGLFSGWGRRTPSTTTTVVPIIKKVESPA